MIAAIIKAKLSGARSVICASTVNTASSAVAQATRADLSGIVLVPEGKIALGKLSASLAYGAEIIVIQGSFDQGLKIVREISERRNFCLVNSINPWRIKGQKTGAFEICDR